MKRRQTQSASVLGIVMACALVSAPSAWAKPRHHSPKATAQAVKPVPVRHAAFAGAGIAAAGAAGIVAFVMGDAPAGQAAGSASPLSPASSSARRASTVTPPYVTMQTPALVVTSPLHRQVTTTSVVIPMPYPGTDAALQVHQVDRLVNHTPPNVAQEIVPAREVDRGINIPSPGSSPIGAPEPAPGLALVMGGLGIGALALTRKRRMAV